MYFEIENVWIFTFYSILALHGLFFFIIFHFIVYCEYYMSFVCNTCLAWIAAQFILINKSREDMVVILNKLLHMICVKHLQYIIGKVIVAFINHTTLLQKDYDIVWLPHQELVKWWTGNWNCYYTGNNHALSNSAEENICSNLLSPSYLSDLIYKESKITRAIFVISAEGLGCSTTVRRKNLSTS